MNAAMKELKARAAEVMKQEATFDTKEQALTEALKQCRNLDAGISVWKAPANMGGKFTIVQFENREEAFLCEYTEVYDTGALYDKVKERYDKIEEV